MMLWLASLFSPWGAGFAAPLRCFRTYPTVARFSSALGLLSFRRPPEHAFAQGDRRGLFGVSPIAAVRVLLVSGVAGLRKPCS